MSTWNPNQYDKFKNERSQPFFDLMSLIDENASFDQVIDLGCGTGELTKVLHEKINAKSTTGTDSSDEMLKKASQIQSLGLQFKKQKIEEFLEPQKYDLIFSNAAIQWVDDHPRIFANLKQSLRPDGQLAVQMPLNHDYPTHTIAMRMAPKARKYSMLSIEEYSKLLYDLGFKEQKVFARVYVHLLENREQVIEWVKGTMLTAIQATMTPDQYQNFLQDYRKELFKVLPDEKPFFYPFKRLLLWAR